MIAEFSRIALWALAGVFAVSGFAKVVSPDATAAAMVKFRVLGMPRVRIAQAVGCGELVLAVLIVTVSDTGVPLVMSTMVLLVLTGLIVAALMRGERFPCGCFGSSNEPLSYWSVIRNGALLALCAGLLIVFVSDPTHLGLGSLRAEMARAATASSVLAISFLALTVRSLLSWNTVPTRVRAS